MPGIWTINRVVQLHWREFGDEWVLFDQASGQTHLLDPLTAAILMLIEEAACDEATLVADLRAEVQAQVPLVLTRLHLGGLIEAVAA